MLVYDEEVRVPGSATRRVMACAEPPGTRGFIALSSAEPIDHLPQFYLTPSDTFLASFISRHATPTFHAQLAIS